MNTPSLDVPQYGTEKTVEKPFAVPSTLYSSKPSGAQVATGTVVKIILLVLGIALLAYAVYRVLPVLLLVFIAIILATAIEPVVNSLRRGPFSRGQGILIVYTGIFAVLVMIGWLIIPVFVTQIGELTSNLPRSVDRFAEWAQSLRTPFLKDQALNMAKALQGLFKGTQGAPVASATEQVANVGSVVLGAAEGALSVVVVFVMAYYWMTERTRIKRWMMSLLPTDRGNRIRRVWDEIEVKVGGWVRGQLTLMALVGLISAVGYFVIGVRYWPALALFIALAEAIPMVGPYIGTAPAILLALVQPQNDGLMGLLNMGDLGGVTRAALVIVFAVLLQMVEGNVLVPRVMRNSVGISALTVIVALLLGSALAGLAGAMLAVPLAGMIQVIVADLQTAAAARVEKEQRVAAEEAQRATDAQVIAPEATANPAVPPEPAGPPAAARPAGSEIAAQPVR